MQSTEEIIDQLIQQMKTARSDYITETESGAKSGRSRGLYDGLRYALDKVLGSEREGELPPGDVSKEWHGWDRVESKGPAVDWRASGLVRLASGRTLRLVALYQWKTYYGSLNLNHCIKENDSIIQEALELAKKQWPLGTPYLIPPARRTRSDSGEILGDGIADRLVSERLPRTAFIGAFESEPIDRELNFSELAVVWFHDEFSLLIAPQILDMDWENLAVDGDF